MLGIRIGKVELSDHQLKWDEIAKNTIEELKVIFGDNAIDIQHIGSTAIKSIKAKPIIDIAIGVKNLKRIKKSLLKLDENGKYKRSSNRFSDDYLYVCENDNIRTHQIHILKIDSIQWRNYINFRDYMNSFADKTKEYESLKISMVEKGVTLTAEYTDGKQEYMREMLIEARLFAELKGKLNIKSMDRITKGWSGDKKYCVVTTDNKYLLRVTPSENSANREKMFKMMKQVAALDVPMCQPIEFGICNEGVYSLQSWIDGENAEDVIPTLSVTEQYNYGIEAGKILKTIHLIPAPKRQQAWKLRFNKKIDRKISMYNDCSIKYENGGAFIGYINANRHLLNNRPQTYQHGDYHIGNMMIDQNGKLKIIDFDRYDFGDPWEEFNRIVWCAHQTPIFASGMVNGYFENEVPLDFWRLLSLYIASNTLSSIPWAIPFGQGQIDVMLNQAKEVLDWYDNMQNVVPSWYSKSVE